MDNLVIRPYRSPDDDEALRAVRAAVRPVDGDVRLPRAGDEWARVAEVGGTVAGFGRVDHWDEADGTRLYLLSGCVDPAWRRRGIGRAVLAHQEAQAAAHWRDQVAGGVRADPAGPDAPPRAAGPDGPPPAAGPDGPHPAAGPDGPPPAAGRALLGGNADETRPANLALLLAAGYRVRFTLVDLARDPAGAMDVELPPELKLKPVRQDDHPRIYEALRVCFADSGHGQHTQTYQDYLDNVRDTDLWLVAWDGDDVAAVVLNEREKDGTVDTPWVAVLPAWRRRGVAQALLQRSLRLLADHGVRRATIRTVEENVNHTVALYRSAGYREFARHPRYAKPL